MTNISRWANMKEAWESRIEFMAQFIKADSSILDLGCGTMALKKYLPHGCSYQSCDVVAREENTIVCDFNKKEFPSTKRYDYVFCSGLVEYINDVPSFLEELRKYSDQILMSYVPTNTKRAKRIRKREGLDWVNHYTYFEFVMILLKSGYHVSKVMNFATQKIFILNVVEKKSPISLREVCRLMWADFQNQFNRES